MILDLLQDFTSSMRRNYSLVPGLTWTIAPDTGQTVTRASTTGPIIGPIMGPLVVLITDPTAYPITGPT